VRSSPRASEAENNTVTDIGDVQQENREPGQDSDIQKVYGCKGSGVSPRLLGLRAYPIRLYFGYPVGRRGWAWTKAMTMTRCGRCGPRVSAPSTCGHEARKPKRSRVKPGTRPVGGWWNVRIVG
jgi:hypothetical protein